jgi:hypothetical protein
MADTPDKPIVEKVWTKSDHLEAMQNILKDAGGLESNVGFGSDYWLHQREYRRLISEGK